MLHTTALSACKDRFQNKMKKSHQNQETKQSDEVTVTSAIALNHS